MILMYQLDLILMIKIVSFLDKAVSYLTYDMDE